MSNEEEGIWTVIGSGMAGKSVLGRLGSEGFRVRAHDIDDAQVAGIRAAGGLHVEGRERDFAPVELATTDLAAAVKGATAMVVCTYGTEHGKVAEQLAPHLSDGQIVLLLQGNFGGVLVFRRGLEKGGCRAKVDVAEMDASPFGVKVLGPDRVRLTGIKSRWNLASSPAGRAGEILKRVGAAFPGMVAAPNLLRTGFTDVGAIFHAGGIITNVGRVESAEMYHFYASNMVPSVCRLLEAMDAERVATARAYGVTTPDAKAWLASTYDVKVESLHQVLLALAETRYKFSPAPKSLGHRFLVQDVGCVLVPVAALGAVAGVPTPATDAAIVMAGTLVGRDFAKEGRSLRNLGLDGKSRDEIVRAVGA